MNSFFRDGLARWKGLTFHDLIPPWVNFGGGCSFLSTSKANAEVPRPYSYLEEGTDLIWSSFSLHHMLPGALGARAASLLHKSATFLSQIRHETHDAAHLDRLLSHVVSFCTDLGPEHGLSEVTRTGFWPHFHASLRRPEPIECDTGELEIDGDYVKDEVDTSCSHLL